jgi:hypothetical protein
MRRSAFARQFHRYVVLCVLVIVGSVCAAAEDAAIEPFLGRYEGRAIVGDGDGETSSRDLDVIIERAGDQPGQFRITWSTITRHAEDKPKRKSYSILFKPTHRPGIFASAMRMNMFGNPVPLDPLKGDPYVWCRIAGRTLTVYALNITDDGGYDLQVYDRTLRDGGLDLTFTRHDEGEAPVVVKAVLDRTGP